MKITTLLSQLEELACKLGIEVRYETFEQATEQCPGGACRLKGKYTIIINRDYPLKEQVRVLGRGLRGFDLEKVYLRPALRDYLEEET